MQDYFTLFYFGSDLQDNFEIRNSNLGKFQSESPVVNLDLNPSEQSIHSILEFACSYEVLETHSTGFVEMNLN